jgi:hypothetical protein
MSTSELLDLIKPLILDLIEDADWDIFNDPILYFILFLLLELMKDPTSQLLNQDLFSDVDKGRNLIKNLFLELVGDPGLHFMGTPGSEEIRSQFDHLASGVHLIEDTGLQEILDNFLNRMSGLTLVRDQRLHVIQTLLLYLIRTRLWQLSKGAVMESCRSCINKKPMTSFSPRCPECLFRTLFPVRYAPTLFPYVNTRLI